MCEDKQSITIHTLLICRSAMDQLVAKAHQIASSGDAAEVECPQDIEEVPVIDRNFARKASTTVRKGSHKVRNTSVCENSW